MAVANPTNTTTATLSKRAIPKVTHSYHRKKCRLLRCFWKFFLCVLMEQVACRFFADIPGSFLGNGVMFMHPLDVDHVLIGVYCCDLFQGMMLRDSASLSVVSDTKERAWEPLPSTTTFTSLRMFSCDDLLEENGLSATKYGHDSLYICSFHIAIISSNAHTHTCKEKMQKV